MYISDEKNYPAISKRSLPSAPETTGGHFQKEVFLTWQAPEHSFHPKTKKWYLYAALVLLAIIGYATYTNSPIMAITFILIGVVGYIYLNKEPRIIEFKITSDGVLADRSLYEFDSIESFWIFYQPEHETFLSLKLKNRFTSFAHIPLPEGSPEKIHAVLTRYLPEEKQNLTLVDLFEKILRL
jgi:hypothetical protein